MAEADPDSALDDAARAIAESDRLLDESDASSPARQTLQQVVRGTRSAANMAQDIVRDANALGAALGSLRPPRGNAAAGIPVFAQPAERDDSDQDTPVRRRRRIPDDSDEESEAGAVTATATAVQEDAEEEKPVADEAESVQNSADEGDAEASEAENGGDSAPRSSQSGWGGWQTIAPAPVLSLEDELKGYEPRPSDAKIDATEDGVQDALAVARGDVSVFLNDTDDLLAGPGDAPFVSVEAVPAALRSLVSVEAAPVVSPPSVRVDAVPAVLRPQDLRAFVRDEGPLQTYGVATSYEVPPYTTALHEDAARNLSVLVGVPGVDARDPKDNKRLAALGDALTTVVETSYRLPDLFVCDTQSTAAQWARAEVVAARAGYFGGAKLEAQIVREGSWHSDNVIHDNLEPHPDRAVVGVFVVRGVDATARDPMRTERVCVQSYAGRRTRADLHATAAVAELGSFSTVVEELDPVLQRLRKALKTEANATCIVDVRFAVSRIPGPASVPARWWTDERSRYPLKREPGQSEEFAFDPVGTQPSPLLDVWVRVRVGDAQRQLDAIAQPVASVAKYTPDHLNDADKLIEIGRAALEADRVQSPDNVITAEDGTVVVKLRSAHTRSFTRASNGQLAETVRYALFVHRDAWMSEEEVKARRTAMRNIALKYVRWTSGASEEQHGVEEFLPNDNVAGGFLDKIAAVITTRITDAAARARGEKMVQDALATQARERAERTAALLSTGLWWLSLRKLYDALEAGESQSVFPDNAWLQQARCDIIDPARLPWLCAQPDNVKTETGAVFASPVTAKWGLAKPLEYDDADAWVGWKGWLSATNVMLDRAKEQKQMDTLDATGVRWGMMQVWTFLSRMGLRVQQFPGGRMQPVWIWALDAQKTTALLQRIAALAKSDQSAFSPGTRNADDQTEPLPYAPYAAGPDDANTDAPHTWTRLCLDLARAVEWRFVYRNDDSSVDEVCTATRNRATDCDVVLPGPPVFVGHARHFVLALSLDPERTTNVHASVATGAGWVGTYALPSGWRDWGGVRVYATLAPAPTHNRTLSWHWCVRWGAQNMWCLRLANQLAELRPVAARDADGTLTQYVHWQPQGATRTEDLCKVAVRLTKERDAVRIVVDDLAKPMSAPPGLALALAASLVPLWQHTLPEGPFSKLAVQWFTGLPSAARLRLPWCMDDTFDRLRDPQPKKDQCVLHVCPFVLGRDLGRGLSLRPDMENGVEPQSGKPMWRLNARKAQGAKGESGDLLPEGHMARIVMLASWRVLMRLPISMLTERIPVQEAHTRTMLSSLSKLTDWSTLDLMQEAFSRAWWWLRKRTRLPGQDMHDVPAMAHNATMGLLTRLHVRNNKPLPATARMPDELPTAGTKSLVDSLAISGLSSFRSPEIVPVLSQVRPTNVTWAQELPMAGNTRAVRWSMTVASLLSADYVHAPDGTDSTFVPYYDPSKADHWSHPFFSELQETKGDLLHLQPEPLTQRRWADAQRAVPLSNAQKRSMSDRQKIMFETMGTRAFQGAVDTGAPVVCRTFSDLTDLYLVQCTVLKTLHGSNNSQHASASRSARNGTESTPGAGVPDNALQGLIGIGDVDLDAEGSQEDAEGDKSGAGDMSGRRTLRSNTKALELDKGALDAVANNAGAESDADDRSSGGDGKRRRTRGVRPRGSAKNAPPIEEEKSVEKEEEKPVEEEEEPTDVEVDPAEEASRLKQLAEEAVETKRILAEQAAERQRRKAETPEQARQRRDAEAEAALDAVRRRNAEVAAAEAEQDAAGLTQTVVAPAAIVGPVLFPAQAASQDTAAAAPAANVASSGDDASKAAAALLEDGKKMAAAAKQAAADAAKAAAEAKAAAAAKAASDAAAKAAAEAKAASDAAAKAAAEAKAAAAAKAASDAAAKAAAEAKAAAAAKAAKDAAAKAASDATAKAASDATAKAASDAAAKAAKDAAAKAAAEAKAASDATAKAAAETKASAAPDAAGTTVEVATPKAERKEPDADSTPATVKNTGAVKLDVKEALRNATLVLGHLGANTEAMILSLYDQDTSDPATFYPPSDMRLPSVGFAPMSLAAAPPGPSEVIPGAFAMAAVHGGRLPKPEDAAWTAFLPVTALPAGLRRGTALFINQEGTYERVYEQHVAWTDIKDAWRTTKYLLPPMPNTFNGKSIEKAAERSDAERSIRTAFAMLAFLEVMFVQPSNPARLYHIIAHMRVAMPFLSSRSGMGMVPHDEESWTTVEQNRMPPTSAATFMLQHEYFNGHQTHGDNADGLVDLMINALARRRWPTPVANGDTLELHFPSGLVLQRAAFTKVSMLNVDWDKMVTVSKNDVQLHSTTSFFKVFRMTQGEFSTKLKSGAEATFSDLKLDAALVRELASPPDGGLVVPTMPYRRRDNQRQYWLDPVEHKIPNKAHEAFTHVAMLLREARASIACHAHRIEGRVAVPKWMPWPSDASVLLHAVMPFRDNMPMPEGLLTAYWDRMLRCFAGDNNVLTAEEEKLEMEDYRFAELGRSRVDLNLDLKIQAIDAAFGTAPLYMLQSSASTVDKWLVAWDSLLRARANNSVFYGWHAFPCSGMKIVLPRVASPVTRYMAAGVALLSICNAAWLETLDWPVDALAAALRGKRVRVYQIEAEAMRQFFYLQAVATEPTFAKAWKLLVATTHTEAKGDGTSVSFEPGAWQVNPVAAAYVKLLVSTVAQSRELREFALSLPRVGQMRDSINAVARRMWSSVSQYTLHAAQHAGGGPWFNRNRLLRQRTAILYDSVELPTATAGPFHLRNWTVDQNLSHLGPIVEELSAEPRFLELVNRIEAVVVANVKEIDALNAKRMVDVTKDATSYRRNEPITLRRQRDTLLPPNREGLDTHAERGARGLFLLNKNVFPRQKAPCEVNSARVSAGTFWSEFPDMNSVPARLLSRESTWVRTSGATGNADGYIVDFPDPKCPAFVVQACSARWYETEDSRVARDAAALLDALRMDLRMLEFAPSVDAMLLETTPGDQKGMGGWDADENAQLQQTALRAELRAWLTKVMLQRVTAIPDYQPMLLARLSRLVQPPVKPQMMRTIRLRVDKVVVTSEPIPTPRCEGGCALILDFVSTSLEELCDVVYTIRSRSPGETLILYSCALPAGREGIASLCYHHACAPALQLARRGTDAELQTTFFPLVERYVQGNTYDGRNSVVFPPSAKPTKKADATPPRPARKLTDEAPKRAASPKAAPATPKPAAPAKATPAKPKPAAAPKATKTPAPISTARKAPKEDETDDEEDEDVAPARGRTPKSPGALSKKKASGGGTQKSPKRTPRSTKKSLNVPDFTIAIPAGFVSTEPIYNAFLKYKDKNGVEKTRTGFSTFIKSKATLWNNPEIKKVWDDEVDGVPFIPADYFDAMWREFARKAPLGPDGKPLPTPSVPGVRKV